MIAGILNYRLASELIATSGQPSADQFRAIAGAGYQVVVNLALTSSSNAIPHEDDAVMAAGLRYFHRPVSWTDPQLADVLDFFALMQSLAGQKVWVHCAMNMRVSCFLYLYQCFVLNQPEPVARQVMDSLWQPDGVWFALIQQTRAHFDPAEDSHA